MVVKKGFTLSEVMVTMTVLGIIAAVLVPTLTKISPSTSKVMFKKTYSTLEKSVNNLISDESIYPSDIVNSAVSLPRGFNYAEKDSAPTYYTNNKFCTYLSDQFNTTGSVTCPAHASTGNGIFYTSDGITWNVINTYSDDTAYANRNTATNNTQFPVNSTSFTTKVIVDIDQSSKSSNTNCSTDTSAASYSFNPGSGAAAMTRCADWDNASTKFQAKPDRFIFGIRYDGKIQIGSAGGTSDLYANLYLSNPTDNKQ